jgi:hypothetical protein
MTRCHAPAPPRAGPRSRSHCARAPRTDGPRAVRTVGRDRACRAILRRGGTLLAALVVTACDLPTELPRFESRFVVPVAGPRVTAADLLPSSMTEADGEFRLLVPPSHAQRTLGDLCEPCRTAHLLVVPKPAFSATIAVAAALPAQVASVVVTSGAVVVQVRHGFGFDPLRPAGRIEDGTLTVVARSDGRVLGSVVFDGALPPATTVSRTLQLAAGTVDGPIELAAMLVSPSGGPAPMNRDAALRIDVVPDVLRVSEARVSVTNLSIAASPVLVDLTGIDEELRDRVRSGALVMLMANPFALAGDLELRMVAQGSGGVDVRRTVRIEPAATTQRIELTPAELQGLLGRRIQVTLAGPLSGTAGPVTVRPRTELTVDPRLDLVLEIGP